MVIFVPPSPHQLINRAPSIGRCSLSSRRRYAFNAKPMPSSNDDLTNASGLKPDETRNLPDRKPSGPEEEGILAKLKELYSCKPQPSTYEMYTADAVFHDPVGIARGVNSIRAQFDALPKLFPRADISKFRLLENPPSLNKNLMLIDQDVAYFRDANASSPFKVVNSLLTLELNDVHQITHHTEEWDHKRETTADDGFFGTLNEQRKKITAGVTNVLMGKGGNGET
ncbi:hypothetical protein FA95DRAFT_1559915 [Auriscalpium vulgare]|uniref:Uncharacterized protein n=1 Tax=Auriscalpium vulgare TaxID=40419 RepID=A0ACB8RSY7_9AGAM|nr:hypothetical protein FA95DRAFT_1559915 [Auriscalpium vulgare]